MNDNETAERLLATIVEMAPYPPFIKTQALTTARNQLASNPNLGTQLVRLCRKTLFPCGHADEGCPACSGADRVVDEGGRSEDELAADTVKKLKNLN